MEIDAYHGTYAANLPAIETGGLQTSEGDEHWLGDGVYFFTEGSSGNNPAQDAKAWVKAQFGNQPPEMTRELIVLQANIRVDDDAFLDLTEREGMRVFNYLRKRYYDKITRAGVRITNGPKYKDGALINDALSNLVIIAHVVKGNFFIKFSQERGLGVDFRIPNTTILAVRQEPAIAEISNLQEIERQYF